jgi:hypothetical protein
LEKLRGLERAEGSVVSVPSTIQEEWDTNPFMRLDCAAIKKATMQEQPILVMQALRDMKNSFSK